MAEFILEFSVSKCPIDDESHIYEFAVRTVPLFSGKFQSKLGGELQTQTWEVPVICPKTGETYIVTVAVPRPEKQKIISVKQKL
jgi:hypothetical protein